MGSPTECNAKPVPMENDKKSLKTLLKSFFHKKKKKDKQIKAEQFQPECLEHEENKENTLKNDDVAIIVSKIENINLKDQSHIDKVTKDNKDTNVKEQTHIEKVIKEEQDEEPDELDNFCFKVINEPRNERIHSHSSSDSGFSEKLENVEKVNSVDKNETADNAENSHKTDNVKKSKAKFDVCVTVEHCEETKTCGETKKEEKCEVLAEELEKLELDDKKLKPKKLRTVFLKRSPVRTKLSNYTPSTNPYPSKETESLRQISQINKHTLTGGQVIVNKCQTNDNLTEINIACENLQQKTQYLQTDREGYLEDVLELIREETSTRIQNGCLTVDAKFTAPIFNNEQKLHEYMLAELENQTIGQDEILQLLKENNYEIPQTEALEVIVDDNFKKDMYDYIQTELNSMPNNTYLGICSYPTPPRSENQVPSPMSASPSSFYPSNSEYILSPERSPISNSDYERYQYIPSEEETIDITRQRSISTSSMTMKQFKDLQKEIIQIFSKKECCQLNRKSCLELFKESMQKLKLEERKYVCIKVATMDLKAGYGVLHHIMLSLSRGSDVEDLEMVLFSMICERALDQNITMFTGEPGLSLLKAAALRCPHKPLLTRYLVQCIRKAVTTNGSLAAGSEYIFHEVDPLGDTLVIACARAGDRYSDVLYELVRTEHNDLPLFKMHHTNTDGHSALHVACSQHSAASPRLHTIHVLLEHGGFELTEGDSKGGDTALHLAVNSTNCDIQLILMMFKHVDRKEWKNLAHCPNLSSKTPLDLARLATKSTSRPNYPPEVLDFLKKCR